MNYKQFELLIENVPLESEVKQDVLLSSKPFFDFQEFIMGKTGMDNETMDNFVRVYTESRMIEMGDNIPDEEEFMELIIKEISQKYGYSEEDSLISGWRVLSSFMK